MKRILIMIILAVAVFVNIMAQSYELSRAKRLIENEEYKEAAMLLRPLAENGNAEAQYLAGILFFDGKGVVKSEEQGLKYIGLAASQDHVEALNGLLNYHLNVKCDTIAAIQTALKYIDSPVAKETYLGAFLANRYASGKGVEKNVLRAMDIAVVNKHHALQKEFIANEYLKEKAMEYGLNIQTEYLLVIDKVYANNPQHGDFLLYPFDSLKKEQVMSILQSNPKGMEAALLSYCFLKGVGVKQNHAIGMKYAYIAANENLAMGKYLVDEFQGKKIPGYRYSDAVLFKINSDGKTGMVYSIANVQATWKEVPACLKELGNPWRLPTKKEAKELMEYYGPNNNMKSGETIDFWTVEMPLSECYYWQTYYADGELKKEEQYHSHIGSTYQGKLPLIAVLKVNLE